MEKQDNNNFLDDLSRKIIKESGTESPSFNFSTTVMTEVEALNKSKSIVYRPLISKTSWFIIGLSVLALVLYVLFFGTETETSKWIQSLDFSILSNIDILSSLSLSKTFTYAVLFFGLMLCIQIPLLKSRFDKRFEV